MKLPALVFEVAFARGPGDTVAAGDWVDLTDRLRQPEQGGEVAKVTRGRSDELSQVDAGEARLTLDNADRHLEPDHAASPWYPDVVPLRPARLQVTHDGTTWPLFRGFVQEWPDTAPSRHDAYVPLTLVDARAVLGRVDVDVDLPRQLTGERINAALDAAGWPAAARQIDPGRILLDAVDDESAVGVLDVIDDAADAEGGLLFFDAAGDAVFHDRDRRLDSPAAEVTFGPDAGHVDYPAVQIDWDADLVINDGRVELPDGRIYRHDNPTSIARYGRRSTPALDYEISPAEAEMWAAWLVARYAEPHRRIDALALDAYTSPAYFAQALDREIADLVGFVRQPAAGGDPVDLTFHIEQVTHTLTASTWTTRWGLSPYLGQGPWFTWDIAGLGWDQATWAP